MTGSGAFSRVCAAILPVVVLACAAKDVAAQTPVSPAITSPADGAVVMDQVPVKGVTDIVGFSSVELAFAFEPDPTQTWFTIQTASLPVTDGVISTWDTTSITDGDYRLRLRVSLIDGSYQDAVATVRVRNYTAVPTPSPAQTPTATAALQIPTAMLITASETPTKQASTHIPTATAMAPNPAGITPAEVFSGFWNGALVVGLLILGFGALLRLRR